MVTDLLQMVGDLSASLIEADSITSVREVLYTIAESLGCSFFLFGIHPGKAVPKSVQTIISNYPKAWQRYYDEHGAYAFDPVLNMAIRNSETFRWDGLHLTEKQLALRQQSVRCGMTFGCSSPHREQNGSMSIMSFCGRLPIATDPVAWSRTSMAMTQLSAVAHKVMLRIIIAKSGQSKDSPLGLTGNEVLCLQLTADGKTAEEVAKALNVSYRTVRYYLERAAEKLGTDSTMHTVSKALVLRIITLDEPPRVSFKTSTPPDLI